MYKDQSYHCTKIENKTMKNDSALNNFVIQIMGSTKILNTCGLRDGPSGNILEVQSSCL